MKTFIDAERQAIAKVWIERGFRLDPIPPTRAPTRPHKTLLQGFEYIPAAKTDIRQSWVKAGWIPIERKAPNDQAPNDQLELQKLDKATRAQDSEQSERKRISPEAND